MSNIPDNAVFIRAVESGDKETVLRMLVQYGPALVHAKNESGLPVLFLAAFLNQRDMVALLIEKGADLEKDGPGALQAAAMNGYTDIVSLLLENGIAVDDQSSRDGQTALMRAVQNRHLSTVALLLEKGADPDKKDLMGSTALAYAEQKKYAEIADLLRRWPEIKEKRLAEENAKLAEEIAKIEKDIKGGLKEPLPYHGPLKFPKLK